MLEIIYEFLTGPYPASSNAEYEVDTSRYLDGLWEALDFRVCYALGIFEAMLLYKSICPSNILGMWMADFHVAAWTDCPSFRLSATHKRM